MLKVRVLSAMVFGPVVFAAVWFGNWYLWTLCLVLAAVAAYEYFGVVSKKNMADRIVGQILAIVAALYVLQGLFHGDYAGLLWPVLLVLAILAVVVTPLPLEQGVYRTSVLLFGALYAGGFIAFLYQIRLGSDGLMWALAALFAPWACDTGAYFSGRLLGKHKLAKNLSPKKTVEGFVGGLVSALILVLVLGHFMQVGLTYIQLALLGVVAGVVGPVGDLAASLFKRSQAVKDYGAIIPGHGGVLDRFDAVIFVSPVFFMLQQLMYH